jgi:hypothetical protein
MDVPKRIEYKEEYSTIGLKHLLIFEVFLGLQRKREGGRVLLDSVCGSHLTCRILTVYIQLTTTLSTLKTINTTKYKDLYLTRWARKLAICHHYPHSDERIFTMFLKSKYANQKLF